MRGVNDGEAPALVAYAHARGITPRFIELMPFGQGAPVPTRELIERLQADGPRRWMPEPEDTGAARLSPPAPRATGATPAAASASSPRSPRTSAAAATASACSSEGGLRSCLGGTRAGPAAQLIRGGATDAELAVAIRGALGDKPDGHRFTEPERRRDAAAR